MKPKNLHIKTVSRYNEISQGYIMKLDTLLKAENFPNLKMNIDDLEEGFDLTEILEIKKFDENSEEGKKNSKKNSLQN